MMFILSIGVAINAIDMIMTATLAMFYAYKVFKQVFLTVSSHQTIGQHALANAASQFRIARQTQMGGDLGFSLAGTSLCSGQPRHCGLNWQSST